MIIISEIGIEVKNLTKKFGKLTAVNSINLKIKRGELFGFLGPNGAGKSTTINMLSTINTPDSGTAIILGNDLIRDRKEIRKLIGVCPQEIVLYDQLTARENIHLIAKMHNIPPKIYKERTDELLKKMNLLDRGNDLVKKFSGGMKRRINVLMAVIHNPEVIFFDEPTAGLDPQSRRVVWDFIKDFEKENKTVILTTHNMEEADDLSERLAIIDNGIIIAEGSPQELKGKNGTGDIIEFRVPDQNTKDRDSVVKFLDENDQIIWARNLGKARISFSALDGLKKISFFYELLEKQFQLKMRDLVIRQNTLEDVFLELTGRKLRD